MKPYEVTVKMVSKKVHQIRMPARSATGAMVRVVRKMLPYEVLELRVKEMSSEN